MESKTMQLMCFPHLSFLQSRLHQLSQKVLVEGLGERELLIWMEPRVIFHGGVWTVSLTIDIQRRIQSKCPFQFHLILRWCFPWYIWNFLPAGNILTWNIIVTSLSAFLSEQFQLWGPFIIFPSSCDLLGVIYGEFLKKMPAHMHASASMGLIGCALGYHGIHDAILSLMFLSFTQCRCGFYLHPAEGSPAPNITQGKLSAPRILRIHKVRCSQNHWPTANARCKMVNPPIHNEW